MRRLVLAFFVIILIISCTSTDSQRQNTEVMVPGETIDLWISSIEELNFDKLLTTYWPDAVMVIHRQEGQTVEFAGIDRIRQRQEEIFGKLMELDS